MRYRNTTLGVILVSAAALLLAGCGAGNKSESAKAEASKDSSDTTVVVREADPEPQVQQESTCVNCGTVVAIDEHDKMRGETSKVAIAGAVAGAVAGVMLGSSQFSGDEETAAEIVGGLAGAAAGHEIAQRAYTDAYYVVRVDMMNGGTEVIQVPKVGTLSVGQEVRVENGTIMPR